MGSITIEIDFEAIKLLKAINPNTELLNGITIATINKKPIKWQKNLK